MSLHKPRIILASGSAARKKMLQDAGLVFDSIPPVLDEQQIMQQMQQNPQQISLELAQQKAQQIALKHPEYLVIGGDQVLECNGKILSKARSKNEAKEKLKSLKGKTHHLISSVCIAQGNEILWSVSDKAKLHMIDFDDAFLEGYCAKAGSALTDCVGAYALEAQGAWLFDKIEGDYFTILGMPLLPLLSYLRESHGVRP